MPMLTAWLVEVTGLTVRETAKDPLYGGTPASSSTDEAKEILQEHHDGIGQRIESTDLRIEELKTRRRNLVA